MALCLALAVAAAVWWWRARPLPVEVAWPEHGAVVEAVYATGTVEPVRWAEIASTETGRIVAYPVSEGEAVARGQILVQLDDALPRAQLAELGARVRFLESDVERYTTLLRRDNVSRQAFDRAVSELDQARAAAAAARQKVEKLAIRAPFEGVVLRKDRELGEVVQPGDVLVWIGQSRPYVIEAQVDEEDIPRVAAGQRTLVKSDAFPGEILEGEVVEITPKGDPINKQYRVRVLLPADSPLLIGMTTEVNVVVRHDQDALLVPESALLDGSLYVVERGVARRRAVTLGVRGNGKLEVLAGLAEGEAVVRDPPRQLRDGDRVQLLDAVELLGGP